MPLWRSGVVVARQRQWRRRPWNSTAIPSISSVLFCFPSVEAADTMEVRKLVTRRKEIIPGVHSQIHRRAKNLWRGFQKVTDATAINTLVGKPRTQKKTALKPETSRRLEGEIKTFSKRIRADEILETDSEDDGLSLEDSQPDDSEHECQQLLSAPTRAAATRAPARRTPSSNSQPELMPGLPAEQVLGHATPSPSSYQVVALPVQLNQVTTLARVQAPSSQGCSDSQPELILPLELPPQHGVEDQAKDGADFADLSGFEGIDDLEFDDIDDVPATKKVRHPEFKDCNYSLVPAGEYSCPPPTSRYKGLLMAFDGKPVFSEDFERQLKASVARYLPDTSLKWLSEDCVMGKMAVLREMTASFGEGLSRKYILQRACHIMETRRSNHRRRAAQGLSKPADLPEAAWQAHLAHKTSKKQTEASQKPRVVNRLGSGGWASICNFCVKEWGFVPTEALRRKAIKNGARKFIAAMKRKNLRPRDPSISVDEIWAKHAKAIKEKKLLCCSESALI